MDSGFKTGMYPGYTLAQLEAWVAAGDYRSSILAEIKRRKAVLAGDHSQMTDADKFDAIPRNKL